MSALDASIVNVALPTMSEKLGVTLAGIAWVVSIYLIVISALIIFFGKIADLTGKTRIFNFSIILFTVGSLICGIADTFPVLLIARGIQAIGAAAGMSIHQGIIAEVFDNTERGRAFGTSGLVVALGNMAGPALGGLIVAFLHWHYIFLINIPIGIIVFILGKKYLPKDSKKLVNKSHLDGLGFSLFAVTMVLLFTAISKGEVVGYGDLPIILLFIASAVSVILFLIREKKTETPMLDLNIFKNKLFSLSIFCALISFFVISSGTIIFPYYLQNLLGMSPAIAGLIILASPVVLMIAAPISGYASDKIGSEILTFIGLLITAISLFLMGLLWNQNTAIFVIILLIGMMSLGSGMFQSPNIALIMSTVPKDKMGIAGSINGLVRNVGMVLGVSLSSVLLWRLVSKNIGYQVLSYVPSRPDTFVYGMHWVLIIEAIICMVGVTLTGVRIWSKNNVRM